jgi:predicted ester cyclase
MDYLAVAEQYFDAWNAHDADAIAATFAPAGTYSDPQVSGLDGAATGAYAAGLWESFPDLWFELVSAEATPDARVAAQWVMHGTNMGSFVGLPPTGRGVSVPHPHCLRERGCSARGPEESNSPRIGAAHARSRTRKPRSVRGVRSRAAQHDRSLQRVRKDEPRIGHLRLRRCTPDRSSIGLSLADGSLHARHSVAADRTESAENRGSSASGAALLAPLHARTRRSHRHPRGMDRAARTTTRPRRQFRPRRGGRGRFLIVRRLNGASRTPRTAAMPVMVLVS